MPQIKLLDGKYLFQKSITGFEPTKKISKSEKSALIMDVDDSKIRIKSQGPR